MDASRFDRVTRILGESTSRRTAIKAVAGSAFGGVIGLSAARSASAGQNDSCSSGCESHSDCSGSSKCYFWSDDSYCCQGYWWKGGCYKDKKVDKPGWKWKKQNGTLYYYKKSSGKKIEAKYYCSAN